jgi:nucleotide-binding universal stress UspA family protein
MALTPAIEERTKQKISAKQLVSLARIMVATDFSVYSDQALDCALLLARRFNSKIYLTHVITLAGHGVMEAEVGALSREQLWNLAKQSTGKIEASGRLSGIPYEVVIEEGALWPALENLIKKHDIDLLVLGTHGMTGVVKVVAGSSAEQIFRQARIPVFTVGPAISGPPSIAAGFKNILCATNFGPAAQEEVAFAFALAQEQQAKLVLLHVTPKAAKVSGREADREREAITRKLTELVPTGVDITVKPDYRLVPGEPVEEILRIAGDTKADLIVIGAKKRESLAGHIPHTKAYRVVCGARCPVLTIKS